MPHRTDKCKEMIVSGTNQSEIARLFQMSIWHWRPTNIRLYHRFKFGEKTRLLPKRRPTLL